MELLILVICMLAAGAVAGVLAGLLGVGGGIVVVPAVFYALGFIDMAADVRMQIAVGSSLAGIIFTGTISARSHYQRGNVNPAVFKAWMFPVLPGVALGAYTASVVPSHTLALAFAAIAFLVALWLLFGRNPEQKPTAQDTPLNTPLNASGFIAAAFIAAGGAVGFVSALMGIGGGTVSVPLLTATGERVHRAVGTSAAIGVLIGIAGTIGFIITGWQVPGRPPFSLGFVNLIAVAATIPASMLTAPYGAKAVSAMNPARVKHLFACFLLVVAANMLITALIN